MYTSLTLPTIGAIIDARLSDMDREQLELTQLNQKLLQCLQLYDSLMQQQFPQQPQLHNPQMANYITPQPMTQQMGGMNLQVTYFSFLSSESSCRSVL